MSSGDCPGEPGDLIIFQRWKGLYEHYAVNVGNGDIIHATSLSDDLVGSFDVLGCCSTRSKIAKIKKVKFSDFVKTGDEAVKVENSMTWRGRPRLPIREIIERAHSKIDDRDYSVLWNNCEHFARWCRYDEEASDQADGLMAGGIFVGGLAALGAAAALSQLVSSKEKEKKT